MGETDRLQHLRLLPVAAKPPGPTRGLHPIVSPRNAERDRVASLIEPGTRLYRVTLVPWKKNNATVSRMLGTILFIILILILLGSLPTWPYSGGWGYYPSGGAGLLLLIVIILLVAGRI
jgi:hypothetical protein